MQITTPKNSTFFGFYPSKTFVELESGNYIMFNSDMTQVKLFIDGKLVTTIKWFDYFHCRKESFKEHEIWTYIVHNVKQYTTEKVYIDQLFISCYSSLKQLLES